MDKDGYRLGWDALFCEDLGDFLYDFCFLDDSLYMGNFK